MKILNDFNTTVEKALSEIDPKWRDYKGLIVCGTHNPHNPEIMIDEIQIARESGVPFLGICFGHQLGAIEYARNVLGIKDATSEEWGQGTFVVKRRPEGLKVGLHDGESYWNNFEVDEKYSKQMSYPDNYISTQYHPEYQSSKDKPHPLLIKFIELCKN